MSGLYKKYWSNNQLYRVHKNYWLKQGCNHSKSLYEACENSTL